MRCLRAEATRFGAIAQLGERYNGIVEVKGSSPFSSTSCDNGLNLHDELCPRRVGRVRMAGKSTKKPGKISEKAVDNRAGEKPVLLSGGNPQIAKADGDAPVQAYIAAMPGWKSELGRRLDALIVQNAPNVRKAVRWNSPFYGIKGQGWFLSYHVFSRYVKVTFLQGALLQPEPPGAGKDKDARWYDIYEDEFDEEQMAEWVRQAAAIPGWDGFDTLKV